MRLKEIKPGMVIHCKTKEEMEELSKHIKFFNTVDNIWNYGNDGIRRDCVWIDDDGRYGGFDAYRYFAVRNNNITEFSDLILPELTAEEALKICGEICKEYSNKGCECSSKCPFAYHGTYCTFYISQNPEKAIEIHAQWKSDHETNDPEIEWVYRVFGEENYGEKFFRTEDEAIKRCEELVKSQKTKRYARYERVCRVKEVE